VYEFFFNPTPRYETIKHDTVKSIGIFITI
jgi:hypothetical protein